MRSNVVQRVPLPTPRNWQWGVVKNDTLWQKRWFQFSHCEHSIYSNIPTAPAYGVYISQLIRYSRACGSSQDFFDRWLLLTRKLLNQGFNPLSKVEVITSKVLRSPPWLGWPLWNICVTTDPRICSTCRKQFLVLSSFMTYHRVCSKIYTMGATSGAGAAYPFGAPEFTPGF